MIFCIGAFDGYHRGHTVLFDRARSLARAHGTEWGLVTFEPHPRFVLGSLKARLFTAAEKVFLRENFDIPAPVEIPFTREFAQTEPEQFIETLCARLSVDGIVVGSDFRFGRNREGDGEFLRRCGASRGFFVEVVPQLTDAGRPVSSTRVRACVERGEMERAAALLGYPYFICSSVVSGQRRGRLLGFPTANLAPGAEKLIPGDGVYAGAAWSGGCWVPAAVSVGSNPTFLTTKETRIEAHLCGFSGDLYGQNLFVAFLRRLRAMRRFGCAEELARQLSLDCEAAERVFCGLCPSLDVFRLPPRAECFVR